jgi:hypothetical protein
MKRNRVVAMLVTGFLLGRIPAFGHHSFAAEFDDTKPIKIKGTITAMRWSNPHAWIHIDVKEADGKVANYAFEMGGINQLYRSGWKKEDLPVGAEVTIDGYLSRTDPHVANSQTIFLADGRKLVSPVPGPTGRKPEGR